MPHARANDCLSDGELADLTQGEPDPELVARIDAHIDACAACREVVAALARAPSGGEPRAAAPEAATGRFGRYVLGEVIGAGATGIVYSARDPYLDRTVAIKVLSLAGSVAAARARLIKEARAIARLSHPNVVAIHDLGLDGDDVFLAMERIDGQTLELWLAEAPRPWTEIAAVCMQAARGLAAAHRARVVHRDFKPANVLVGRDGRVRVADFGLAHADEATPGVLSSSDAELDMLEEVRTATGALIGTPAYMAPEQVLRRHTDERSDQFSFAVTLFEALHGCRPHAGRTWPETRNNLLAGRIVDGRNAAVPARLRGVLRRALASDPQDRFPSMDALIAAVERPERRALWLVGALAIAAGVSALVGARFWPPAATAAPGAFAALPDAASAGSPSASACGYRGPVFVDVYRDRASFERAAGPHLVLDFDDVDTRDGPVSIAADRYAESRGALLRATEGQWVGRGFGFPDDFPSASAPNSYAAGPTAPPDSPVAAGGHDTDLSFVDGGASACVSAVGAVFEDVEYELPGAPTGLTVYDRAGSRLGAAPARIVPASGSLQFLGLLTRGSDGGPVAAIARAHFVTGNSWLTLNAGEGVALDDIEFSAPRAP